MGEEFLARPLLQEDIPKLKVFLDQAVGLNYYSLAEVESIFTKSSKNQIMCSFVLEQLPLKKILGARISFPPGNWSKGKGKGLSPELWKTDISNTAYFQSLFIAPTMAHKGWGKKLSRAAIEAFKKLGAKAIVTHSWKNSPNDSSGIYLRSLGFEFIASHENYWIDVDYNCTRCLKPPCLCTAEEMIKYL